MEVQALKQDLITKGKQTGLSYRDILYEAKPLHWSGLQKRITTAIFKKFISDGSLELVFDDGDKAQITAGSGKPHFTIRPPSLWSMIKIFARPQYHPLQTYVDGEWTCIDCDLVEFFAFLVTQKNSIFVAISEVMEKFPSLSFLFKQYVTPIKSTRKTHIHYDVPADFYEKLLHPINIYSCAFFEGQRDNLQQAQMNKLNRITERLGLQADTEAKILDIGCGWGETAFRLASKHPKVTVSGISISSGQIDYAKNKLETEHSEFKKRIDFELCDYRNYKTREEVVFDNIVSVGMLEHVGKAGYYDYFSNVRRLLRPGGKALIHTITCRKPGATNQWIDKNIFPGGYIPMASEVLSGIEKSGLRPLDTFHHDGENYYKTLQSWKINLLQRYDEMLPLLREEEDKMAKYRYDFRRWYAYISGSQSFFLPGVGDGAVMQFLVERDA